MPKNNSKIKQYSKLPKTNMTGAKIILWSKLRMEQPGTAQFYRQKTIGNYMVDFYNPEAKLVIELEAVQPDSDEVKEKDKDKDDYLKNLGFKVLKFQNKQVRRNIGHVMKEINSHVAGKKGK